MALELTILKVEHFGRESVARVAPHLRGCHVFGPESAGQTAEHALSEELAWQQQLAMGCSADDFESRTRSMFSLMHAREAAAGIRMPAEYLRGLDDFNVGLFVQLYKGRIPLWHAERHDRHAASVLTRDTSEVKRSLFKVCRALREGNVNGFIPAYAALDASLFRNVIEPRDRHIAGNLHQAEQHIRARYPELERQVAISYVIEIGAMHSPENYLAVRARVVDLVPGTDWSIRAHEALRAGATPFECRREILAAGFWHLRMDGAISIADDDLANRSFEELKYALR